MKSEIWRPIPGYEGSYEVSNLGRARSLARKVPYKNTVRGVPARILSPSIGRLGYHFVYLRSNGETHTRSIHTLVLAAFVGPRPPNQQGRHLDGNPRNNKKTNLTWGTVKINQRDRIRHNTDDNGEKSANAKLTWRQVEKIRSSDESQYALAKRFGVSQGTISDAKRFKTWRRY